MKGLYILMSKVKVMNFLSNYLLMIPVIFMQPDKEYLMLVVNMTISLLNTIQQASKSGLQLTTVLKMLLIG